MLKLVTTAHYKCDYKGLLKNKKYDIQKLDKVTDMLLVGEQLPYKYQDHSLKGKWAGFRECHIEPDWLLIYKVEKDYLILTLARTGTHSDLF